MSIDVLQDKIRKLKNPTVVDFTLSPELIPESCTCEQYCVRLLEGLKGVVPAVRFGFASFCILGTQGMTVLESSLRLARDLGYYIILDLPELLSPLAAEQTAAMLSKEDCVWEFDAVVVSSYLGTDVLRPLVTLCKERQKALFVIARTANKSASEIQDLLTGTRLVHAAVLDLVNRIGEAFLGKYAYSQVAAVISAVSESSIKNLRPKNKNTFFLLDGYDYSFGNSKKCSNAFDKYGRGAICCAGSAILGAWRQEGADEDCIAAAVQAAERIKKNMGTYVTIV